MSQALGEEREGNDQCLFEGRRTSDITGEGAGMATGNPRLTQQVGLRAEKEEEGILSKEDI